MRIASGLIISVLAVGCAGGPGGYVTPDDVMAQAATSVEQLRSDNEAMDYFLERSVGALVFPDITRAGLVIGAVGGSGVLVERDSSGRWGSPMFVEGGGITFGAQAGGETAQVIVVIMNRRLIGQLKQGLLDFGVGASIALGPADLKGAGSLQSYDAYVFRSRSGLYGGLTLDSAIIKPDTPRNNAFHAGEAQTAPLYAALSAPKKTP